MSARPETRRDLFFSREHSICKKFHYNVRVGKSFGISVSKNVYTFNIGSTHDNSGSHFNVCVTIITIEIPLSNIDTIIQIFQKTLQHVFFVWK